MARAKGEVWVSFFERAEKSKITFREQRGFCGRAGRSFMVTNVVGVD